MICVNDEAVRRQHLCAGRRTLPEATSSEVTGAPAFKSAGGVAAGGALLAIIVVVLMTPSRTHRGWAVGVISTVVAGIGGGAIAVPYFRLQEWVIVRWVVNFIEKNRDAGSDEVAKEAK
ncbi:hypothetical protein [Candidatus Accumulibacter sp. ACC007]|uniref:hypothetical protein n=1 Tax=Candidatus Accumulibacter sp. ACC007 TaxID=2823333 RepID=UPI0025C14502|nr:hypothetical protein [Candidatus Accumulibacter sp. ACC007]